MCTWDDIQLTRTTEHGESCFYFIAFEEIDLPNHIGKAKEYLMVGWLVGWLDLWHINLSKSARVVLITWSPSGYTPVGPDCPDVLPSLCLQITGQLVRTHGVTRNEPKIHDICNITVVRGIIKQISFDNNFFFKFDSHQLLVSKTTNSNTTFYLYIYIY